MSKWRVYNKHPDGVTHKERFREDLITIKPGEYVLMDYEDAVQFKGQYYPMKFDAMGQPTRETFKCIAIEPDDKTQTLKAGKKYVCNMDGREFPTQAELDAYTKANYADETFVDEAIEEEIKVEAKRRGRPPKDKTDERVKT